MQRTDSNDNYTTNGFQNYIDYDDSFFMLVEGSIECMDTGMAKALPKSNDAYVNYLQCQNIGNEYAANFVFCTFQLVVLGTEGSSSTICSKEVLAYNTSFQAVTVETQDLEVRVTDGSHSNLTTVGAKAPTCTEIGWDTYEICNDCGYTTYKEKAALGHSEAVTAARAHSLAVIGINYACVCKRHPDRISQIAKRAVSTYFYACAKYISVCQ